MHISFYCTPKETLLKTSCQLLEKCYYTNLKALVLTADLESQELLNRALWTYSQKHFIPHGSEIDPLPEKQPIYITHNADNNLKNPPNAAKILILINSDIPQVIHDQMLATAKSPEGNGFYERVMVIYDDSNSTISSRILDITRELESSNCEFSSYTQDQAKGWVKL